MSTYKRLVDFIYIIQTKPDILSAEDCTSLEELLPTVSDDLEALFGAIENWYKTRLAIVDAILKLPIGEERALKGRPINLSPQELKKITENEVRQHKSRSNSPPRSQPKK